MRVALITDGIWPYVLGGMQKHSYYLCKYLARNRVHVDLVHFNQSHYDISLLEFFSEDEKQFISAKVIDFPASFHFPGHYLYNSYRYSKIVYEAMHDKLATYDFIYTKGFSGWYLLEQKSKNNFPSVPVGVNFHGYEMFQKAPDLKTWLRLFFLLRYPVKKISRQADVVFSYGGKITGIIHALDIPMNKIVEMPSGVEKETLATSVRPRGTQLQFLFLGRYERRKGIEELNKAITNLPSQLRAQCRFHFIGPIPENKKIKSEEVVYHGEVRDRTALTALITQCDVLLCPSWSEGMPNVILEAMSQGLAVVATDTGATSVLVNHETGILLDSPDPVQIREAIRQLVEMPSEMLQRKKQHALDLISDQFTWDKLIGRLYEKLHAIKTHTGL